MLASSLPPAVGVVGPETAVPWVTVHVDTMAEGLSRLLGVPLTGWLFTGCEPEQQEQESDPHLITCLSGALQQRYSPLIFSSWPPFSRQGSHLWSQSFQADPK